MPDAALETALALALGRPAVEGEPLTEPDPEAARLAILDAELGATRAQEVAPRFDARRHVRFDSAWASARWDLVGAYHDAVAGRLTWEALAVECDRLAAHAERGSGRRHRRLSRGPGRGARAARTSRPSLARVATAAPVTQAAVAPGHGATAAPGDSRRLRRASRRLRRAASCAAAPGGVVAAAPGGVVAAAPRDVCAGLVAPPAGHARRWSALPLRGVRPTVEIAADGVPVVGVADDATRPRDLILGLASGAPDAPVSAPADATPALVAALGDSLTRSPDLRGEVALVTGAAPGSIAVELVKRLLRGGATVVVATSTDTPARRRFYRDLYRTAAGPGAALHVVPANLASFADIDALAAWLREPGGGRRGRDDLRVDPLLPTLLAPFAAVPTTGDATEAGAAFETAFRLQLLGVQRLVGALAPPTVLLPLSPNHGAFGSDGPYGETKAALELMLERARSEPWGRDTRFVAPRIGWVRGTGLMARNDAIAPLVEERLGLRTFAADEMGWLLAGLITVGGPLEIDASGGLSRLPDLREALEPLAAELRERSARNARRHRLERELAPAAAGAVVEALPAPGTDAAPAPVPDELPDHGLKPEDLVVIVGTGELGPGGTGRSRFALELDELDSPGVVAELAWLSGLVRFELEHYRGRWIDAGSGDEVPEERLAERYADEVARRVGLREVESDGTIDAGGHTVLAPVDARARAQLRGRQARRRRARSRRRSTQTSAASVSAGA